jgi:hypothetical protein
MNLLKKFHRGEEGMESIQVIMILAAAAVVITGVALIWNQTKDTLKQSVSDFFKFKFNG